MNRQNDIEREKFNLKVKRNIKKVILILLIIFAAGLILNKIYINYKDRLYKERDRVSYTNEDIVVEYIDYLHSINNLIVDMICGIDVNKEYYNAYLELNRNKYGNLRKIVFNREKYDIDRLENNVFNNRSYFHVNSNWSTKGLLLEEELTREQEVYLSEVYKVNNKIIEVYQNNSKKMYIDGNRDTDIYYELYYEGRMYYDLVNRLYEATDGKNFEISTKLDTNQEYPEKVIREEDILKRTSEEYAILLSEILTGEKIKFSISNEGRNLKYTFDNDLYKYITVGKEDNYMSYYNEFISEGDMLEESIDKKAEEIIKGFGVNSLKLIEKKYEDYFTSRHGENIKFYGYEYNYYIVDGNYIDLSAFVKIVILTDGTVHEVYVYHLNIIDGTYKILVPKISMQQAKLMLDEKIQQNIVSYRLIRLSDNLNYEFEFNMYGMKLYAGVNTDSGEIVYYRDTSYRDIVE